MSTPAAHSSPAPGATPRSAFFFLNAGHALDHLFMLLYPTVVLTLEQVWQRPYAELLALATPGFVAFGACAVPAGWLADRWGRRPLMIAFFCGIGAASCLTGLATGPLGLAVGLTLIGTFASIYHPVGIAMVVQGGQNIGRLLGINGVWGNMGVAGAALIAGWLSVTLGWRAAFLVPGAASIAAGLWFAAVTRGFGAAAPARRKSAAGRSGIPWRIWIVLALVTTLGGFVFNASLVALPKYFEERMTGLISNAAGVGTLVGAVYVFGAMAQLLVGPLLDKHPLRTVLATVAGLQVPFLLAAAYFDNGLLLVAAGLMMFTIFGQIPINDTLVARITTDAVRSRVYALKYVLSLGVSALAVPSIALVHGATGSLVALYAVFAGVSLAVALIALALPPLRPPPAQPAPATGGTLEGLPRPAPSEAGD